MEEKKYRPNVAAIILSSQYPNDCKIFVGQRKDLHDVWQFPQGGIDEGEQVREALLRELWEEIGTREVEILGEYPKWLQYDFPPQALKKFYPFQGQRQRYFLVRLKSDRQINIHTENPEFVRYDFVPLSQIFKVIKHFKKPLYKEVLDYFKQEGFL
ncbi:RNA pyrophosphohydrolase [Helicobacter enhydrae]|uniref:RNA pyrophosphohydrolase n=1 Tax=Helicobacter enhydrae TaxID=222136 RepID=A0A1B1U729_9HELI|nr:RNA pyrophosphohydrolase [Helicobacter enhydrae]ANV98531.1 RNA pyrophosphohydrolase [Helicobacter enhydrae]